MFPDRRGRSDARAMSIAREFERSRGADVSDVSGGRDRQLREAILGLGARPPIVPSADLISVVANETRIIEVKGRGSMGPIDVIERQLHTFAAAGSAAWLYVIWNTTQLRPYQLVLVQDPMKLPWAQVQNAERAEGQFRGARHEAKFRCQYEDIERLGVRADLSGIVLPEKELG